MVKVSEKTDDPDDSTPIVGDIDLFVTVGLLLLCLVSHVKHRYSMPASGPLIVLGIVIRLVGRSVERYNGSIHIGEDVENELIELIFLPTLITECALSLDWHLFYRQIFQILVLAVPAVIFSSVLTAVVVKEIMGYDSEFNWYEALLIGAIFSATDHVSVVAILKEVKADDKLLTLMQAETLVNDGTVFVLFTFALSGATGKADTGGELTKLIFRQTLGGIGLALGFSLAVSIWLYFVVNDAIVEALLTLCTSYLLFYTSTISEVDVSGALGTVVFGLYMSAYGKLFISPKSEKSFHFLWKTLGTAFEALLLLLCGSFIGGFILDKGSLRNRDIGMLFALFVLQYIVRAITILIHYPLIWILDVKTEGKKLRLSKIDLKKIIVLIFGGLKGTMSISLALILHTKNNFSDLQHDLILFWAVGITGLCNTFGALFLLLIIKLLGLESMSFYDHNLLLFFEERLRSDAINKCENERKKHEFQYAINSKVRESILDEEFYHHLKIKFGKLSGESENFEDMMESLKVPLWEQDKIIYVRKLFFRMLKGAYAETFERHTCYRDSYYLLIDSANNGIDTRLRKLRDWDYLEERLLPKRTLRFLQKCSNFWLVGRFFARIRYYFMSVAYDIAQNYVKSHEEVNHHMWESLDRKTFNKKVKDCFLAEFEVQIDKAKEFIDREKQSEEFQAIAELVQTNQLRLVLSYYCLKRIQGEFRIGMLGKIQHSIASNWFGQRVIEDGKALKASEREEIYYFRNSYLFEDVRKQRWQKLTHGYEVFIIKQGENIRESHTREGLIFVIKGKILVVDGDVEVDYIEGEVAGIETLLSMLESGMKPRTGKFVARTEVDYAYFPKSLVTNYVSQNDMLKRLCVLYIEHEVRTNPERFGDLGTVNSVELRTILHKSDLCRYSLNDTVSLNRGLVLVCGSLLNAADAPSYFPRSHDVYLVTNSNVTVLNFLKEMSKLEQRIGEAVREYRINFASLPRKTFKMKEGDPYEMETQGSINRRG